MKKRQLLLRRGLMMALFSVFGMIAMIAQTYTDVTSSYLTNADFNTAPVAWTTTNQSTAGTTAVGGTLGFAVANWTSAGTGSYNRFSTANYGITFTTKPDVLNGVNPPSTDKNSGTSGACVMISGAWGTTTILTQNVTLPPGKYRLEFEAINQNGTNAFTSNRFGFVSNTGGVTYYGTKTSFASTWATETVSFTLTEQTAGKISIGFVGANVGSATSAKLAIDNVKLYQYIDKTILTNKLTEAKAYKSNGTGIADFITAINTAQTVNDNASATDNDVTTAINNLQTAINTYLSANQVDKTSSIVNPSFENTTALYGWTNTNTMARQSNTPGMGWTKDLTYYAEKWIAAGSNLPAAQLSQTVTGLTNGVYRMTLSAHAVQQNNYNLQTTGASAFAGSASTNVNFGNNYTVYGIVVTDGTLNIGFKTSGTITCNWVGYDNFKLYYLGTVIDPVITAPETTAALTTSSSSATINLTGSNLTSDITITVPSSHISLSGGNVTGTSPNYTIALANANQLNSITATWDIAANVSGNISFVSGTATKNVSVTTDDIENVSITGINLTSGALSPAFSQGTTTYTVKVPVDKSSVTVTAAKSPSVATVTNDGTTLSSSNTSVVLTGNSYNGVNHTSAYTVSWGGNWTFDDWDANGDQTSTDLSKPSTYGWKCMNTTTPPAVEELVWNNFGTQSNCRYRDVNAGYTYNSSPYTDHRVLFVRWDAGGAMNRVFSYPVYLEGCKTYNFTSKAAWNSNGSAPTLTYRINSASDNTGTTYATGTAVTGASGTLVDANINNITVASSGVYYITITSSTASLCAVTDLSMVENVTSSVTLSKSTINLYHSSLSTTFTVTGNALASDISLTAPAGIILSATGITPGQNITISKTDAQCGVTVTATYDEVANIIAGTITASSDALSQTITLNASKDAGCFTPVYEGRTNIVTEPYMNSLTAYSSSWGNATVSSDDQYCGALSGKVSGTRAGSITYPLTGVWAVNTRYRIKAKVKVASGSFNLNVSGWSGASADIVNTITSTGITYNDASTVSFDAGTWNSIDFRFTTGATINSGSQFFYFNNYVSNTDGVGYIDNVEMYAVPLIRVSSASISMTTAVNTTTFDVIGNNLAGDINLVAPAGITLSGTNVTGTFPNYVIALANANATNTVTASWDKNATITGGTITLSTSDGSDVTVSVSTSNVDISTIASIVTGTGGVLSPAFDAATTSYSIKAPADIASVTVTGTATSSAASISNNGNAAPVTLGCTSYNGLSTTNYSFSFSNYTLDDWDANGSTDASLSIPTVYGWSATTALTWAAANAAVVGTSRYFDFVNGVNGSNPTYTYNGENYNGRLLMVRWDGGNLARIYSYPVYLAAGNTYQINGKAAYNSNTTTPTITFNINSAKNNSGTGFASGSILTSTAGLLKDFVVTNIEVPVSGVYYLTITSDKESMCAIGDIELNSKVSASFTGSSDNTWSNAGNWTSSRTPLFGDDVTIPSGNITIDVNAKAHGVAVAAGAKLTVASGKSLNANSMTINSDATGTATFVNSGTATIASASVNQYLTTGRNWYISSPVTNATASSLLAGASKVYRYNEPTATWVELASGDALEVGKGYITQSNATGAVNFAGNLNDGNVQVGLVRTLGATKAGFNLVGNPYPSYLNWKACYEDADNTANAKVGSTIWYRTKNAAGSVYKFATYNAATNLGTAVEAGDIVTGNIPPMQAFWVKVEAGNETGTLTFKNSMRAHKGSQLQGDEQTYTDGRMRAPSALQQVLRLQVASNTNSDDAIVLFNTNASNGLDQYDSYKMSNNTASIPEIYTTVASEDLVINGMNSYDYNTSLALGFKAGETNTYTISAPVVKNFDADTKIILLDESTGTQTDLTAGESYTFTSDATTTTTRFSVLFKSASGTTDINPLNNLMNIFSEDKQIVIESNASADKVYRLKIFNSTGQIICDQPVSNSHVTIDNLAGGVYVVKLNMGQTEKTVKAIIR